MTIARSRADTTRYMQAKVTGVPMVDLAARVMLGARLSQLGYGTGLYRTPPYYAVKVPVFSFQKLADANSMLGTEMKSTGEVLGLGKTMAEALFKGLTAAGFHIPDRAESRSAGVLISVEEHDYQEILSLAKRFADDGMRLYATAGTAAAIASMGIEVCSVANVSESNEILRLMEDGSIRFIVYTGALRDATLGDYTALHRRAMQLGIPCLTSIDTAGALANIMASRFNAFNTELVDINDMRPWKRKIHFAKMQGSGNDYIFIENGRIYRFFHREGLYAYDPVRLLDYKLNCVSAIVDCCQGYDPDKGADFLTYAYYDIGNAILNCRRYEESGSFKNLDEYKTVRGIAWLYNKARDSRRKTIAAFMEKTGCTKKTAEDYLTAARKNRGNVSIYDTILRERDREFSEDFDGDITEDDGEDLSRDAGGVYNAMLWDSSWGGAVQRAHSKLDYRSQILIERHMAVCMDCRCVLPLGRRPTWEDLAAMFEGSTASGAERAYKKAVQKLAQLLIEDGLFHTIVLKCKRQKKRKEKITAATYLYQADSDGEWGEIQFDFENKTAEIIRLADWEKMISQPFAKYAISYLLNYQNEKLPKETVISFEE